MPRLGWTKCRSRRKEIAVSIIAEMVKVREAARLNRWLRADKWRRTQHYIVRIHGHGEIVRREKLAELTDREFLRYGCGNRGGRRHFHPADFFFTR